MKAIAITPGTPGAHLIDWPEPELTAADQVKMRVIRVGICGTDREEVSGWEGRAKAPEGQRDLVIGHEMLGQVESVGQAVTTVRPGDYAVITVRRSCGECMPCLKGRPDLCRTGRYRERGIWGLDGFQSEYVVDNEANVVRVPAELEPIGVLIEPLTVVEKAVREAVRAALALLQDVLGKPNSLEGIHTLVAGLGPVGLLGAMILRLHGAEVVGTDVVDASSARPQWLIAIGGQYVDGRTLPDGSFRNLPRPADLILEAAGVARLEFSLLEALARDGVYVLTGVPGGDVTMQVDGAEIMRRLVMNNQVLLGSVNTARQHYEFAVDDLLAATRRWGDHVQSLITEHYRYDDLGTVLEKHGPNEIKAVVEWNHNGHH